MPKIFKWYKVWGVRNLCGGVGGGRARWPSLVLVRKDMYAQKAMPYCIFIVACLGNFWGLLCVFYHNALR